MRKPILLTMVIVLVMVSSAFALLNDESILKNSTNQLQGQNSSNYTDVGQGQHVEDSGNSCNMNWNEQGQGIDNSGNSEQNQKQKTKSTAIQGQLGEVSTDVSTPVATKVNIEGDDVEAYANTWPTTPSTPGKEERSLGSIFGSLGFNKTEEQVRLVEQMKITEKLFADGVITKEEYDTDMRRAYKQLKSSNKGDKLLGIIPFAGRGCNVINGCGLLSW